jgi:hypothetical protein
MGNKTDYNGHTNYETFLVSLWIGNDQESYKYWTEQAIEIYTKSQATTYFSKLEEAYKKFSDLLSNFLEESNPLADKCDLFSDLIKSAIKEVDTYQIAKNWIDSIKEHVDQDLETEENWILDNITNKE